MRKLSILVWVLWIVLTLAGSETVSRRLLAGLEGEFANIDPLSVASSYAPFDLVVSLGGSTRQTPARQVELTEAGDRIVVAARLYHAGQTRQLAATGEPNAEILGPDRHPADEARVLWQGLGVPKEAIVVLNGSTTKDEFQVIAQEAKKRGWERIGVVTSAWHMRRALRLADAAGLAVEPLPADFIGATPQWDRIQIVPSGQALFESSRALKEYLARAVGR
jgi:uncharacterized SAM-binding protein YcdF (DUF218 family)